jgi:hypothetical protein
MRKSAPQLRGEVVIMMIYYLPLTHEQHDDITSTQQSEAPTSRYKPGDLQQVSQPQRRVLRASPWPLLVLWGHYKRF